jgi:hypothetical protein
LRLSSITIDADGSPSGYVAWYNYSNGSHKVRSLKPTKGNAKFGVQRMEMLAIYFALADNLEINMEASLPMNSHIFVNVRSDSRTCVEQLQGKSEVRDALLQRICAAIRRLLERLSYVTLFNHLERSRNVAGFLIDQRRRREEEEFLMHQYEREYYRNEIKGFVTGRYLFAA